MQSNPLINKTFLLMITEADGHDVEAANLSIQKGMLTPDGKYNVNCVAASTKDIDSSTRSGTYTVKQQSDNKLVLHMLEETGQFVGEFNVTIDWLDQNTGTWHGKKDGDGSTVNGVIKTIS